VTRFIFAFAIEWLRGRGNKKAITSHPFNVCLTLLCSVDGDAAKSGIWVKGVVKGMVQVTVNGKEVVHYTVEHTNWKQSKSTMTTEVPATHIRQPYP
jgi:hypothetical protein